MSDTVTQALRRIASAEGATYSLSDTDVVLARRIYEVLSGGSTSKSTFVEISKEIATQVGATPHEFDGALAAWRKIVEARGGSSSNATLLGLLQESESVGLSGADAPATPANLSATEQSASEILVEWDAVDGVDSYQLQHSTDGETWADESTISAPTVQYSDTGLNSASIHYYRIKSVTGELSSDYSSSVNATTQYEADAQALFDLVEGTDGATYLDGAKDAINMMVAGIKADGNWSVIEDLWFTPGIDLTTSGGTATLAALGRTVKGNTVDLDLSASKLHRHYTPSGAGAGVHTLGRFQESSPDGQQMVADFGFTGVDGFFGMLGWVGEQTAYGPIYGVTSSVTQANTELRMYADASNSSRIRMHGSGTEHKAYGNGTGLQAGWLGGFRNGTLLNNLRNNTVLATVNSGGASDASTAVAFDLYWAGSGNASQPNNMVAFLSAPGASDAQRQAIQARINTCAQTLGVPSSSSGATIVQCYGDSLMMGSGAYNVRPFPEFLRDETGFDAWYQNLARSGAQTQTVHPPSTWRTNYGQYADPDGSYFSGKVCFLLIGTNDLAAATAPSTIYSNIQSFCGTMQTAGYSVVVMTVPPRDDVGWSYETERGTLNSSIVSGEGTDYDVLFDLDDWISNTLGGSGITPSNTTYYQADKLHFTDALYEALAASIAADSAIAALF